MTGQRTRSLSYLAAKGGTAKSLNVALQDQAQGDATFHKVMTDWTSKPPFTTPQNMDLQISGYPSWTFTGRGTYWDVKEWYTTLSIYQYDTNQPSYPADSDLVTHALAVSNPNRPIADIGMIAQDIFEFPKLARDIFAFAVGAITNPTSLMRARGKEYLTYEFGLQPTIDDLKISLDFVQAMDKRLKMLKSLRSKGLSRTTRFGDHGGGKGPNAPPPHYEGPSKHFSVYALNLYGPSPKVSFDSYRKVEVWVSTKFKLNDSSFLKHPSADPITAARALLDLGANQAPEIWELMPWSWLINWFSNIGDIFAAGRNSLDTTCTEACLMTHTMNYLSNVVVSDTAGFTGISLNQGNSGVWQERKTRKVFVNPQPSLSFHLPFLDGGQLSILAALLDSKTWGRG